MMYRASEHLGALAIAGLGGAGVLSWTLLEYLLHRWVFHFEPDRLPTSSGMRRS